MKTNIEVKRNRMMGFIAIATISDDDGRKLTSQSFFSDEERFAWKKANMWLNQRSKDFEQPANIIRRGLNQAFNPKS